ncbi:hypothetical protein L1887_07827 [Cichorium endivia]|nr:hypothetical protein L1887_07827 [Cichorium endivia]
MATKVHLSFSLQIIRKSVSRLEINGLLKRVVYQFLTLFSTPFYRFKISPTLVSLCIKICDGDGLGRCGRRLGFLLKEIS